MRGPASSPSCMYAPVDRCPPLYRQQEKAELSALGQKCETTEHRQAPKRDLCPPATGFASQLRIASVADKHGIGAPTKSTLSGLRLA